METPPPAELKPAPVTAGRFARFFDLVEAARERVDGEPEWAAPEPEGPEAAPPVASAPESLSALADDVERRLRGTARAGQPLPAAGILLYRWIRGGLYPQLVEILFDLAPGEWEGVPLAEVEGALGFFMMRAHAHVSVLDATVRGWDSLSRGAEGSPP